MKKTMKRFAAITATMMTISALGSISAFADPTIETDHYIDTQDSQNANVELKAKVSQTDVINSAGAYSTNVDTEKHIWNVTIDTTTLTWDIVRTNDTKYQQKLTWDPSTHSYVKENDENYTVVDSYRLANNETADKTFNIHNDSNFAITSATTTTPVADNFGVTFTAEDPQGAIGINGDGVTTITIDISNMNNTNFASTEYVTLGTASIALTASGEIQAYNEGNQQEVP